MFTALAIREPYNPSPSSVPALVPSAQSGAVKHLATQRVGRVLQMVLILGITTLVSFSGFLRDLVLGWQLGPGIRLDTLLLGIGGPLFVAGCAGAAFNLLCLPQIQAWAIVHPREESLQFERALFWQYARWCTAAFLLILVAAPCIESLLQTGFRYEKTLLTMKVGMAVTVPAWCFSLSQAILTLLQRHGKRPALLLTNTLMPAGAALVALWSSSLSPIVIGLAAGALVQLVLLLRALMREGHEALFKGALFFKAPAPRIRSAALLTLGTVICLALPGMLELTYSGLLGLAGTSRYTYGVKIPGAFCAILGGALGWKLLALYANQVATQSWQALRQSWLQSLFAVAVGAGVLAGIGDVSSALLVKGLFVRGNFTAADAQVAVAVQRWAFWVVPLSMLSLVGQRLLAALMARRALFTCALTGLLVCAGSGLLLTQARGYEGLIWSMLLTHGVFALGFNGTGFWLLSKKQS